QVAFLQLQQRFAAVEAAVQHHAAQLHRVFVQLRQQRGDDLVRLELSVHGDQADGVPVTAVDQFGGRVAVKVVGAVLLLAADDARRGPVAVERAEVQVDGDDPAPAPAAAAGEPVQGL